MPKTKTTRKANADPLADELKTFKAIMKDADAFMLEHKLWRLQMIPSTAFRWDQYILLVLNAIRFAPTLVKPFDYPLNAMYWLIRGEMAKLTKSARDDRPMRFLSNLLTRVEDSRMLRNQFVSEVNNRKKSEQYAYAAAQLRKRGLM